MLVNLSIRNIVLIEKLDLTWRAGLCTLTGETGAGKSILLDALALATGARGDAGLVRSGADQGTVIAAFDIAEDQLVTQIMQEHDIPYEGQIILRRVQSKDGRSRAFINDTPVSVNLLKTVGSALVEIHGQNESQSLTDGPVQLSLIDSYAGHQDKVHQLKEKYVHLKECEEQLELYKNASERAAAEEDFLRYSLEELEKLDPKEGEEEKLSDERTLLMNSEKIAGYIAEALALLEGDKALHSALNGALRQLEKIADQAAGRLDTTITALERAVIESDEAQTQLHDASRDMVYDPQRLEQVEERLFGLKALARKHGVQVDQLPATKAMLQQQLDDIKSGADRLEELRKNVTQAFSEYKVMALSISKTRLDAAEKLDKTVMKELEPLKLNGGGFQTAFTHVEPSTGSASGIDSVQFMASTNPGMPSGPISKIASGGELARFMLALKVALAEASDPLTMVFDEVDAGVGGAVAEAVGSRLKLLAESGQVLVVTHSPQVAACGNHQWLISKSVDGDNTMTRVDELSTQSREEEIARMLSGALVTEEARAAAVRLLGGQL
ncbi:MAG: DNA repair protein RecN [PS1 clade bacterium]|uniref:DNA repair protein RecN n=1 Tax=PS1 clade bacterium TaxID=2175152 RepID=A0A368E1G7_9PROT|nr:MAG: DNA repair protein RecN [PS1 clade bacterium]HCV48239.1 DNA repair protein RecN [Rhodobiaceae bacterium]|tara:strand:- start:9706 stop:11373 length:1668 start_codon:yes stop_codon:yes gene_type:complete